MRLMLRLQHAVGDRLLFARPFPEVARMDSSCGGDGGGSKM